MVVGAKRANVPLGDAGTPSTGGARKRPASSPEEPQAARRPRKVYTASFKLAVVREALKLPASNRIKPTCRMYPGVEPVQVRKWIRNIAALQMAQPSAKLVQKRSLPSPPDLSQDDSSETEIDETSMRVRNDARYGGR